MHTHKMQSQVTFGADFRGEAMTRRFLFVLGSSRPESNTEMLARHAAEQLPAEVEQQWIRLIEHPLPDFEDLRHDSDHVRPTDGDTALLLDATLAATDIVIASPLYWYSLSAPSSATWTTGPAGCAPPASTSRPPWPAAPSGASPRSPTRSRRSPPR